MERESFARRLESRIADIDGRKEQAAREAEESAERQKSFSDIHSQKVERVRESARELAKLLSSQGNKPDTPIIVEYEEKTVYEQERGRWLPLYFDVPKKKQVPIYRNYWLVDLFIYSHTPAYYDSSPGRFNDSSTPASNLPAAILLNEVGELLIARSGKDYRGDSDGRLPSPKRIASLELEVRGIAVEDDLLKPLYELGSNGIRQARDDVPKSEEAIMDKLENLGLRVLRPDL